MTKRFVLTLILIVTLGGCGDAENEPGPGGVSRADAQALDDAAAKLDAEAAPPQQ